MDIYSLLYLVIIVFSKYGCKVSIWGFSKVAQSQSQLQILRGGYTEKVNCICWYSFVMAYIKQLCKKKLLVFVKICPPTGQIKKGKFSRFFSFSLIVVLVLQPISKYLLTIGLHWFASYNPMSVWTPHMPIMYWTLNCTVHCTLYCIVYSVHCTDKIKIGLRGGYLGQFRFCRFSLCWPMHWMFK